MGFACLICGATEDDAPKLHHFPRNVERCRIWLERLGFRFTGESLKNYRICSGHFARESYSDLSSFKLLRNANPIAVQDIPSTSQVHVRPLVEVGCMDSILPDSEQYSTGEENVTFMETNPSISSTPTTVVTKTKSTDRKSRTRIFRNIENLSVSDATPRKKSLIKLIRKKEDQLRKVKFLYKRKSHDMKALSNHSDSKIVRNLFKDMPSITANFMISQIKNFKVKGVKGRRWTLEDKILALCIFKRSPRCYNLIRKFAALPNKTTVLSLLRRVPFKVGINPNLFTHIGENLPNGIERCCALLFDEMDIKENVQFDQGEDKILGFEDFGPSFQNEGKAKLANKALVFMLVGLSRKWKQPVAFYFNNNGCSSTNLQKCLFEVLYAAKYYAQVDVVVTICDMGSNNVKCMKELGASVHHPFFLFEDKKVYTMYDPPHLLKCTYSLFRKYNVILPVTLEGRTEVMEAKFGDVVKAYEMDKNNPLIFRTMHKIKDTHLNPIMQYSMKVSIAAHICSHTVAAYLYSLISAGVLDMSAIATATFIKEVDTLFDSFNGQTYRAPDGKDVRCSIKEDSPHLAYWAEAFEKIQSWTFQRKTKSGAIKQKPPSQIGWLISMNAIRGLWDDLRNQGFSLLRPRSLNQDPLENLFGAIRYGCGCSDNPTVKQFIGSFKTQILNGLANQSFSGRNCEEDDHKLLSNLQSFLNVSIPTVRNEFDLDESVPNEESPNFTPDPEAALDVESSAIAQEVSAGCPSVFSVAYVAGFILKGIHKLVDCELCKSKLTSSDMDLHNTFICYKEWWKNKTVLSYPSEHFTTAVGCGVTELEQFLEKYASHQHASIIISSQNYLESKLNFDDLGCADHIIIIKTITSKSICKIGIPWWCKRQNENMKVLKKEKRHKKKMMKLKHN